MSLDLKDIKQALENHWNRQDKVSYAKAKASVDGFEKKFKNFDAEKWFDENVYEDWTWEGMLEKFIETEILGIE